MKIEKLSEQQIRCTLTKEDLADREIKIQELAYGTEKAKNLFRDMMQQASYECGFEADDIPLMIEAIPLSDCIVLVITKVEDPEELDTRFSKFAPSVREADDDPAEDISDSYSGADGILDIFRKIQEAQEALNARGQTSGSAQTKPQKKEEVPNVTISEPVIITKIYSFADLDDLVRLARVLAGFYKGENSLYKDEAEEKYTLVMSQGRHTPAEFNKICNVASEYGREAVCSPAFESFLKEHSSVLIKSGAIAALSEM